MNEYIKKLDLERRNGKITDLSKVCRLCVANVLLVPLFEGDGLKHQLVKKIRKHLSIQVKDVEGMSPHICYKCACTLMDWDDLVATSLIADARFRQYVTGDIKHEEDSDENSTEDHSETFSTFKPDEISRVYKKRRLRKPNSDVYVEVVYKSRNLRPLEENPVDSDDIKPVAGLRITADGEESGRLHTLGDINEDDAVLSHQHNEHHEIIVNEDFQEPHEEIILANNLEDVNIPRRIVEESENNEPETEELSINVVSDLPEEVNLRSENISLGINLSTGNIEPFSLLINGETYQFARYVLPESDNVSQQQILEDTLPQEQLNNTTKRWLACEGNPNIPGADNIDKECVNSELNQCDECQMIFNDQIQFLAHKATAHLNTKNSELDLNTDNSNDVDSPPKLYPCSECDREFVSTRRLYFHAKYNHSPKEHVCKYCGDIYEMKKDLETHLITHTGITQYTCATCNETFSYKKDLLKHQKVHKKDKTTTLTCATCGKMFQNRANLTSHLKSHLPANILCSLCGKVLKTRDSLRQHLKVVHSDERPFPCTAPNCNKSFKTNAQLKGHISVHTGERNYVCEACGSSFHNLTLLIQHKLSHTTGKPHACDLCSATFNRRGNLTMHKKKHASGYTPKYRSTRPKKEGDQVTRRPDLYVVQCTVCNKWLKSELTLKYHMGKHLKDKHPFDCEVCGQRFISSLAYKIHERIHTGETPFACSECDKSFRSRSCLNQHSLIHSDVFPHPCPFCDRAFKRLQSLLVHKKTHTGEKNHKCPSCGRAFAEKGDMRKHLLTHNREKTVKQ